LFICSFHNFFNPETK